MDMLELRELPPEENNIQTLALDAQGDTLSSPFEVLFDAEELVQYLCSFLSLRDMMAFRQVNRYFNFKICENPLRREHSRAVMSASWHKKAKGLSLETCLTWKHFALRRFRFCRHSSLFKVYWLHVAQNMTHLSISDTSLECDGLAWILNNTPQLNTLVLNNAKLRDLTYQHAERVVFPHNWARDGVFPKPLKSLTVENTSDFEPCFLDYLVHRTGSLSSVSLGNCFYKNEQETVENQKLLRGRFAQFQVGFSKLLRANAATVKSVTLKNNAYQGSYFALMTEIWDVGFYPRELYVEVPKDDYNPLKDKNNPPDNYYDTLVQFLQENGRDLAHLTLHFNRPFKPVDLDRILVPVRKSLVTLSINFYGNLLESEVEFENLNEMPLLESFEVNDLKMVDAKVVKSIRVETDAEVKPKLLAGLNSNIAPSFLAKFPGNLNSLTIGSLVTGEGLFSGFTEPEQQAAVINSFQNLTKFEFLGPWLHPVKPLIEAVTYKMPHLKTLALTNCNLFDGDITGLNAKALKGLKNSLNHLVAVRAPASALPIAAMNFVRALTENPNTDEGKPRPLLSRLAGLEHVNLSRNCLSDIALFESLKIPGLKTLNLSSNGRITDNGLEMIGQNMPNLELLNIRNVRKVTKYGINRVVCGSKKLRCLYTTKTIAEMGNEFLNFDGWSPNFYDVVQCTRKKEVDEVTDEPEQDVIEEMEALNV